MLFFSHFHWYEYNVGWTGSPWRTNRSCVCVYILIWSKWLNQIRCEMNEMPANDFIKKKFFFDVRQLDEFGLKAGSPFLEWHRIEWPSVTNDRVVLIYCWMICGHVAELQCRPPIAFLQTGSIRSRALFKNKLQIRILFFAGFSNVDRSIRNGREFL